MENKAALLHVANCILQIATLAFFVTAVVIVAATNLSAQALLMTLSVESAQVEKDFEFILTLEIYAPASPNPPEVTIDGLTQFDIGSRRRNLQQVPGGRTVKWIFTYALTAHENGGFKLGPARAESGSRSYYSNTLFITVEGKGRPPKKEVIPPVELPKPIEPPKPITDEDIGEKILILMESSKTKAYRGEGLTVTFRLLSQFPVENLSYLVEPEFPGFLKYDFPFTSKPKAEKIRYRNVEYVGYELQRFLIFPLDSGLRTIPGVSCALKVRIPATVYSFADTRLDIRRDSNTIRFQVEPVDPSILVGHFSLRNEIVSDAPQIKVIRFILDGDGQLSTFDFPAISIPGIGDVRPATTSTVAKLLRDKLKSRKTADYQVFYIDSNTTNIVLPEVSLRQLDPARKNLSWLRLPPLKLLFEPGGSLPRAEISVPLPDTADRILPVVLMGCALPLVFSFLVALRPRRTHKFPLLRVLLRKKNPQLQISKNASLWVYRQIMQKIAAVDGQGGGLIETVKQHLPEEDWLHTERIFRKLEFNAFAKSSPMSLTYGELQEVCTRLEKRWLV